MSKPEETGLPKTGLPKTGLPKTGLPKTGLPKTGLNEFSKTKVPQERTYSGLHIALIVIGGTIGIPAFLMAANIGASLGLFPAIKAFTIGCLVLGSLGALTGLAGVKSRFSAYMLTKFAFGRWGAHIANLAIALSLIGWYGVISNMFGRASYEAIFALTGQKGPLELYIVFGSLLILWVTISGFKGLDRLALFLVPCMAFFLLYAAFLSYPEIKGFYSGTQSLSFSTAISTIIGSYIAGVLIQPDYSRYAKNVSHAMGSAFIALGVSFPLVLLLSAMPSIAFAEPDLIKVMISIGIGLPAFLLLLLSSWSSNVLCLYSAGLSLATLFTKLNMKTLFIGIGILGTALAFLQAQAYLIKYLILLGVVLPPIAAIYVIDCLLIRKGNCNPDDLQKEPAINKSAFTAWILAILVGYLASRSIFSITSVAALDSIFVGGGVFLFLKGLIFWVEKRKIYSLKK